MPGPDPKPKSTEPAARACCNWPSPRNEEISAFRPTDFQMPRWAPNSSPAKGKDELIALPIRILLNSCARVVVDKPDIVTAEANRAKMSRRLGRILPSLYGLSVNWTRDLQLGQREASRRRRALRCDRAQAI